MTEANNAFIRVQGLDALIMPSLISIKSALRQNLRAALKQPNDIGFETTLEFIFAVFLVVLASVLKVKIGLFLPKRAVVFP